jgi:hypothetical protein
MGNFPGYKGNTWKIFHLSTLLYLNYMKKDYLKYLIWGTIFWGIIIGLIIKLIFGGDTLPIHALIIAYVFITALFVLIVQFYIGGFPVISPKKWFLIPLAVWLFIGIWGTIEGYLYGIPFSLFDFIL